jgi:hypothetical protein
MVFVFQSYDVAKPVIRLPKDLAKFVYRPDMKVKF